MVQLSHRKRKEFTVMASTEQAYKDQIKDLEQQILLLKEQVDFLTRKLYGTKSNIYPPKLVQQENMILKTIH